MGGGTAIVHAACWVVVNVGNRCGGARGLRFRCALLVGVAGFIADLLADIALRQGISGRSCPLYCLTTAQPLVAYCA